MSYGYLSDEAREDDSLLDDAARFIVTRQCADEHGCNPDDVSIVGVRRFSRAYENGRNIGEVELRYPLPADSGAVRAGFFRAGHIAGALYGVYTDGTFSIFAD